MESTIKNIYKCKDGRWRAYCINENNKPYIVSYPRILIEKKLGRSLEPYEDVHHIDGNIDNNDISNLKIIPHGEHQKKHSTKYVDTVETCMICGSKFIFKRNDWAKFYTDLHRNKKRILTCSKSCAGKASSNKYTYLYNLDDRLKEVEMLWKK